MIDEQLYADLVELYNKNVKEFINKNSGLLVDKVYPLQIEDIENVIITKEIINRKYISSHYIGFTINPAIKELEIKNNISTVEIIPDISWERKINQEV